MLLFKDKVTTGAYSLALFIWNVALAVATVAGTRLAPTTAVIFDITQFSVHLKLNSVSQLTKGKSRGI